MARATSSLPVPLSPVISAVASRGGELADELENLLHRLAAADDAQFVILRFQQRLVGDHLLHVARGLERVGDDLLELGHVERLEQVIVGPELHRLDGGLRGAVGGHQDDQQLGVDLRIRRRVSRPLMPPMRMSMMTRSGLSLGISFKPFLAAGGGGQLDFRRIEDAPERVLHVRFVIDQQQFAHDSVRSRTK